VDQGVAAVDFQRKKHKAKFKKEEDKKQLKEM
jgi:hypothetical protein